MDASVFGGAGPGLDRPGPVSPGSEAPPGPDLAHTLNRRSLLTGPMRLIGRDEPFGLLRDVIKQGGLVLVTGESGIGKTALLDAVLAQARQDGALVAAGSCWSSSGETWPRLLRTLPGVPEVAELGALASSLADIARQQPLVIALDDLDHADSETLDVLGFLARHTRFERVTLLGACADPGPDSPLLSARGTVVPLSGLGLEHVRELMAQVTGEEPDAQQAAAVHRRSGGNPFFVEELTRLWHTTGSTTATTPAVRQTVCSWLARLPEPVVRVLSAASVLGREFHCDVLSPLTGDPVPRIRRRLDAALGLLVCDVDGRYSFAHGVVRDTLYEDLAEDEACRLHAAAVDAYERIPGRAGGRFPSEVAHHAYFAGTALERTRVLKYLLAASRDPGRRLAPEERIRHYRRALELVDDPHTRVKVTLDLVHELQLTGATGQAWPMFHQAAALARDLDDPELLARAALTLYRGPGGDGVMLAEAHTRLFGETSGQSAAMDLAGRIAEQIAGLARSKGDDEALGFGLSARHDVIWGLGTAAERERLAGELAAVARRTADAEMEQYAADLRWVALLELGDPTYVDHMNRFVALAESSHGPRASAVAIADRSIVAALTGRFDEAEALLDQLRTQPHPAFMAHHLRWALLLQQGRFDELTQFHETVAQDYPFPRLIEAITAVQSGDCSVATRYLADRPELPRMLMPLWLRLQAQVAVAANDPELRRQARAELRPYEGLWLVSLYGGDISGPVALWLATLDAAEGDWDAAVSGFREAQRCADVLGAVPWSLEARTGLAEALLATKDLDAGLALLDEVEREATRIGMRHLLDRVSRIRAAQRKPDAEFRNTGEVWELSLGGLTIHMPDAKGLRDLHTLLSAAGEQVPAQRLLSVGPLPGSDEVLDETAKASYARRLAELDAVIERATELGEEDQAVAADREREALLDQLRAATGFAGRTRRLGDEAERARKTVTARIRDTLRKLDARHPELARHLRESVVTGASCAYQPKQQLRWRL
ncbi:ATP-binding protein [Kibdelosporangium aridum]|uniref:ATP-binding protein n=1 Tax=Kibdelosporangium aridum TaxID=2030 RepID=UPI0035E97DA1